MYDVVVKSKHGHSSRRIDGKLASASLRPGLPMKIYLNDGDREFITSRVVRAFALVGSPLALVQTENTTYVVRLT